MTKPDFPKIIKTTTLTKLSHGEGKWIDTPTTIRASEFENIVPSINGQPDPKSGFEKCRFRKISLNQKSIKNTKFAPKIPQKLISNHQNLAKTAQNSYNSLPGNRRSG